MNPSRLAPAVALLATALTLPASATAQTHGIVRADMDTTVAPCQDFYRYANGGWIARTVMPAAYARYGGFEELQDRNLENVHRLLEDAVQKTKSAPGGNLGLLATFYGTCMDSGAAEKAGAAPIKALLDRIASLPAVADLGAEAARLHMEGIAVLFFLGGFPDPGNSNLVVATANQGGLGLPDRDYYLKTDSASVAIRREYVAHIGRALALIGVAPADANRQAETVMKIETALARASITRVAQRDPKATYNKMPLARLEASCPTLNWRVYLATSHVPSPAEVNVRTPGFFASLDTLLRATPVTDWRAYLTWHVVRTASPVLSSPFVREDFQFQRVLTGTPEMLPRWRRCLEATDRALGESLGQEYVKQYFTPEAKARALTMVQNLKAALRDRIQGLTWMGEATKTQALKKLDAMGIKIGYPDRWRDYSALALDPGSFCANVVRAAQFERAYRLAKIGGPPDKGEFSMTPPTVNARYSPQLNDILFPAGILQPPFFDPEADDAVNYGGIGSVIGHEMTHGFDDSGRQFDGEGNLKDWWTPEDAKKYQVQADRIIAQFNGYTVLDTVHVNGKLTTGENLSDVGGLKVAYAALQKALAGKPQTKIDGLTPEQRFFLAYARIWRQRIRPEESRRRIAIDSHAPGEWRVRGPLSNLPEFQQAFGCKGGEPMVRPDSVKVAIW